MTMFSVKSGIVDIEDVPVEWVFEYYLKLGEKLRGQDVKLKSVFNPKDSNPSMYVYLCRKTGTYKFKCFSTGIHGNQVSLVMLLNECSYAHAIDKIIEDYRGFIVHNAYEVKEIIPEERWIISNHKVRLWNKDDVAFWSPYNIGSTVLDRFNVRPLESYEMSRNTESFTRKAKRIYGYFTKDDQLYRIYQPLITEKKFLINGTYVQGWDQITGKSRLFICSSMKDIMTMYSILPDADYIAPSSENAGIEYLIHWIKGYPEQYVIFDNDAAGIKMMKKYDEVYNIPYIHIPLSKDISDSVKDHGASKVKSYIKTVIPL